MPRPGDQIGAYRIERELGRGGMGVVYLATDERLGRSVAIKALPDHLAGDAERLGRFEREARLLAALHHPNIAGIHGVEERDGARYLVLEHVEGETLAERLDRGPIPVDEVLEFGAQIAAGVGAAHDAGVVHRDLKPGNIMLAADGTVKVLDFGLARVEEVGASSAPDAATVTSPVNSPTVAGVILGTAPYMSPEQARGRRVDRRTDLWSLGVILYEMLTGVSPFVGETATDSIGAVLHKGVDLSLLPAGTPAGLRRVIERCLVRDQAARWRDAGDVRVELAAASGEETPVVAAERRRAGVAVWVGAVGWVAAAALGAALLGVWRGAGAVDAVVRTSVLAPEGLGIDGVTISADGRRLAVIASPARVGVEGQVAVSSVWVRDLSWGGWRAVPGSEGAYFVGFSPDGGTLAFTAVGADSGSVPTVYRVASDLSSPPVAIQRLSADFMEGSWGSIAWTAAGELAVLSRDGVQMAVLDAGTGRVVRQFRLSGDEVRSSYARLQRAFGDGHFAMTVQRFEDGAYRLDAGLVDLETGAFRIAARDASGLARLDDGRVLFVRGDQLCVSGFDPERMEVAGAFRPVQTGLATGNAWGYGDYSLSRTGTLAYVPGGVQGRHRDLVFIGPDGDEVVWGPERRAFEDEATVSADGRRLAVLISNEGGLLELWVSEVERPRLRRLFALRAGDVYEPVMTPDGERVVFTTYDPTREEPSQLMVAAFDGGEPARRVWGGWAETVWVDPDSVSPDGRSLYARVRHHGKEQLVEVDLVEPGEPRVLREGGSLESPAIAPNGDPLLAFISEETGRHEAYVSVLGESGLGATVPATADGAWSTRWSVDGAGGLLLHHVAFDRREWVTPVSYEGGRVTLGAARETGRTVHERIESVSLTRDGRMLSIRKGEDESPAALVELVQGWGGTIGEGR